MHPSPARTLHAPPVPHDILLPLADADDAGDELERRKREAYETGIVDGW